MNFHELLKQRQCVDTAESSGLKGIHKKAQKTAELFFILSADTIRRDCGPFQWSSWLHELSNLVPDLVHGLATN